ncbi:MAG: hypothetical protein Q7U47_01105 [Paludibacter sp.]|nr:hypothetical protein [Paludibacter sp.]
MSSLIDLNSVAPIQTPAQEQNFDWLKLHDLKNGNYSFGFWNVSIQTHTGGQQSLKFGGVCKTNTFEILENFGFCKRYREDGSFLLIRNIDNILTKVAPVEIKDFALDMINGLPEEVEICGFKIKKNNLVEVFLREHNILFGENSLSPLKNHTKKLLADTPTTMFFPYKNGVAKVTKQGLELIPYSNLRNLCIWENHIIKRHFSITDVKSMFENFIQNVSSQDPSRIHAIKTAIGYLLHRYYTSTCTKAVVFYDEAVTDNDTAHGGTGKGIVANAISQLRETAVINGKRFDTRERFALQKVNESTEVVFLDDILPDFDFEYFNSILTDGWEVEHKNKTTIRIPFEDSPKLIISSNHIMKTKKGETASRRQFIIEISDFYSTMLTTTQTPIVDVHGCEFFRGWDAQQWNEFDNFMLTSCSLFLKKGLPVNETKNVVYNRLLQATSNDFCEWVESKNFLSETYYHSGQFYMEFKNIAVGENGLFSQNKFTAFLKLYAETNGRTYKSERYNAVAHFRFI